MKLKIEKEEYINKTFRLNVKLAREMEKVCDEKNISLNKLVAVCLDYTLANLERDTDDKIETEIPHN